MRYEIAVSIKFDDIVAYNGPFPCGKWPDIKIFRHTLKGKLGVGEKVIADRGYRGDLKIVIPHLFKNKEQKKAMDIIRARHETVNGRLKNWNSLQQKFRHSLRKHNLVFRSVLVLEQIKFNHNKKEYSLSLVILIVH